MRKLALKSSRKKPGLPVSVRNLQLEIPGRLTKPARTGAVGKLPYNSLRYFLRPRDEVKPARTHPKSYKTRADPSASVKSPCQFGLYGTLEFICTMVGNCTPGRGNSLESVSTIYSIP
ncbi:hypothetical protein AVEN_167913-1 [Araneus ventricosus]|uniref:Uncharacterized protein n=1 Tax=Araneus ventricosus TaxID=182803 RepID=A0A4Y2FYI9_ARAVE|nr:hypothetical protein AVEN_167913-1 [Araneus ventricosus]